jgi:competence protein ComEC
MHRTMEDFLAARPFERGPSLAVVFGLGIAGWAVLSGLWQWAGLLALCGAVAVGCIRIDREGDLGHLRSHAFGYAAAHRTTIWQQVVEDGGNCRAAIGGRKQRQRE